MEFCAEIDESAMPAHDPSSFPASFMASSPPLSTTSPLLSSVDFTSGSDAVYALSPWPVSPSSKASPSRLEFMHSFVNMLLPQLKKIHTQKSFSPLENFSAVKAAADMSLAISAGGSNLWSQALLGELAYPLSKRWRSRKNGRRTSTLRRGKIYARILRSNRLRAACMRNRRCTSSLKGAYPQASSNTMKNLYHVSSGSPVTGSNGASLSNCDVYGSFSERDCNDMCCRKSPHIRRMRHSKLRRQCARISSYVKILRKLRFVSKPQRMKAPVESSNKASRAQIVSSISKEQIVSLGGLVPGGHSMDVPLLFQEAADYIRSLQMQVEALQALSHSVSL